ncbi:NAD(P)-dependent dehydrogenase (short-subunit alcohol dehydrogenase family) [Chitinivorax tropicus]|uniref:NAD(P)-dependent dehydrogenase (Short-subunit alcohol dehydrogenase family) n=1 Tax=Chitinivorax tropicus TaxID=714531 RepID=A0A840MI61_9PROT|nr:SDR family NAD(P)-dependent oxidoreductase [Chitinivorax tropicus]MBB5018090.1 NAD(P)-dependent dehydrogenase (short-subunit alcohol dehydrogenase family) [Chitinivorax tropicus]
MKSTLTDKVIAIPGGFGYLGSAIAQVLLAAGAKVALIGLVRGELPATEANLLALPGVDLTDLVASTAAFKQVAAQFGGLDGVVNVAGGFRWELVRSGDIASWDAMYQQNVRTAVIACQAALPLLQARGMGRIVNIGANAATKAVAGMGAYTASKSGVARLTESLADELKSSGITVNAILPAIIDTPQNRVDMPDADFSQWTPPESIAQVIAFLLSDEAHAVSGALIPVTGGRP